MQELSKKLIAQKRDKGVIECFRAEAQEEEIRIIAEKILEIHSSNLNSSWNDFAVLVRTNSQADIFIETFIKYGIPCQFIGSKGLFQHPEILDLISYLKVLVNPDDSKALYRVIKTDVFNFYPLDIIKLLNFAKRKNISLFEALSCFNAIPQQAWGDETQNLLTGEIQGLSKNTLKSIKRLLEMIKNHLEIAQEETVGQVLYKFLEDSEILKKLTNKETKENSEKIFRFNQLFKKIEKFERENQDRSIRNFVEEIDLIIESGEDFAPSLDPIAGPEGVKIMTVHSAKGLEFENVFLANLVDKRFPCLDKKEEIEIPSELIKETLSEGDIHLQEERRLFYVACTRAKKRLFFSWAEDCGGVKKKKPSRFLQEIGELRSHKVAKLQTKGITKLQNYNLSKSVSNFSRSVIPNLPRKFSYTQLKAFSTCPKQYKYAHILFIPRRGSHTFSYGKTIHNTLRKFYSQLVSKKHSTKEELLKIYQENFISDFYESKEHLEKRKKAGEEALKKFYQTEKENFSQPPLFLEKGFNLKVGNYSLKGVIDRLDSLEGDSVEIIDYKTGETPKEKKDKEQLLIYALAVKEVFRFEPSLLSYYYIDQVEKISFSPDQKEIENTKKWIIETVEEILRSKFSPNPGWHCQFCDFKEICEERKL